MCHPMSAMLTETAKEIASFMQKRSQPHRQSQLIPECIITAQVWHPHSCAVDLLSP